MNSESCSKKVSFLIYAGIAVTVTGSLGLSSFMSIGNGERFKAVMLFVVFLSLLYAVVSVRLGLPKEHIFYAILIAGLAMRIGYAIYTYPDVRQHDVWDSDGHYPYIMSLYENFRLPAGYEGQFYHGPLSHLMIALFLRLVGLTGIDPLSGSWIQVVPCALSSMTIVVTYRTARALKLKDNACLAAAALTAFHPTFYLLAGSINNDMAMTFFFFLAVLYTVKYYNQPTFKNILLLAVAIGCSMMSKLSGGMIALFTGPVFLAVLILCVRQARHPEKPLPASARQLSGLTVKRLIGQFAAFLAVCAPLGLWHSIRNMIKYHQPLGYVPAPPIDSDLYIGWRTIGERFFSFPLSEYFGSWCNPRGDYNLWTYMLKCAIFGEWEYNAPQLLADSFLLLFLILAAASFLYMIWCLRNKGLHPVLRYGLPLLTVVQLISYVSFNIGYPFGCTMDFRYIVPTIIPFAVYTALFAASTGGSSRKWKQALSGVIYSLIGAFCALSVLFYVII